MFRGSAGFLAEAAARHGTHPRGDELRAFFDLAVLLEGELARLRPAGGYVVDLEHSACARALGLAAAAWRGAATTDLTRGEIAAQRAAEALAEPGAAADPRHPAAQGYADLAAAELRFVDGDYAGARRRLQAAATRRGTPPACALAARGRLAMVLGRGDPRLGLRGLDGVAAQAERLGQVHEALHARLYAGLHALSAGDHRTARSRLEAVVAAEPPADARRYATFARLLLATLGEGVSDDVLAHVAHGIRLAAADGDSWAYLILIGFAARAYMGRGAPADALVTLSAGIEQMRRTGGDVLALPLLAERHAIRLELGEEAYAQAIEAAMALLD